MSSKFWGDSILTVTYLINRMPSRVLSFVTPSRNSKSFFLILDSMHIFHLVSLGPLCLSTLIDLSGTNLIPERLNVFLGYSSTQKGYKCYDPILQKLYISLDITFFEHTPYYSLQGESVSETRPPLTLDYLDVAVFESTLCLISTSSPNTEEYLNLGGDTKL